jgi:putative spermidine/putrescine transport system ATP-binding protein
MTEPQLELRALSKHYGGVTALHDTDLCVQRGEFVTVLGPSGCGKSTLLRMLMGISQPSSGEIHLAGARIDGLPPERRDIAMVFQSYALFPHMNVRANLAFGLKMRGVPKAEQDRRIGHAIRISNLEPYVNRMPRDLSGGQQQRVALARAVVMQPALMLYDEPLSNLDAKLRESLRGDLLELHRQTGATSLYVTHDQTEAMAMSDRVVVMNLGQVVEVGTPEALYHRPRRRFTATFLGQTNLLDVEASGESAQLPWGGVVQTGRPARGRVTLSARPEEIALCRDPQGEGTVQQVLFQGPSVLYAVQVGGLILHVSEAGTGQVHARGERVRLSFPRPPHVLDEDTAAAPVAETALPTLEVSA